MRALYNFFEREKADRKYARDVQEYMAKAPQWIASFAFLDQLDVDAFEYSLWLRSSRTATHRMEDPRGKPGDAPVCACGQPVAQRTNKKLKKGIPAITYCVVSLVFALCVRGRYRPATAARME